MATYSYTGKSICIITGASRGFGQAIAQLICHKENGIFGGDDLVLKIVLMSRSKSELEKVKALILKELPAGKVEVCVVPIDISSPKLSSDIIVKTLGECGKDFQNAFLFNNAGTLGDPEKLLIEYDNVDEIQTVYNLNIVTPSLLIAKFCKHFEGSNRFIANTSSLAALQPFRSTGLYSTSKASMDMFIKNLVTDCPQVRAINYAPGPLDTQMAKDLKDKSGDEVTRGNFHKMFDEGTILSTTDSAKKLMMLLRKNDFENGSHIDFYDI